jgi:hypothetical protein
MFQIILSSLATAGKILLPVDGKHAHAHGAAMYYKGTS